MVLKVFFFPYKVQRAVIFFTFVTNVKNQHFLYGTMAATENRHITVLKGSALENYIPFG